MRILGLTCEEDSGAALVEDGRILAAENEERIARIKLCTGFPRQALRDVLALGNTGVHELDAVVVAGVNDYIEDALVPPTEWFRFHNNDFSLMGLMKRTAGRVSRYRNRFPALETGYYLAQLPEFWLRRRRLVRILRREFDVRCPIRFVDHHFAHLTSAYFTSGFDDALVISIDGGGDARSARVYAVRDGRWESLHEVSAYNSLGNYYAYCTHLCGFKAMRHEGKVTGLAAYGEPRYVPLLREFIDEEGGTLVNRGGVVFRHAIEAIEQRLPSGWTREDLAASIQRHFEDVVGRFVGYWARRTGLGDIALAGGVFANVRVNQVVHELPPVRRIFVHPGMTDGGLGVGAALAACVPGVLERTMQRDPEPLAHVYLGHDLREHEVAAALHDAGLEPDALDGPIEEAIADRLAEGCVVAHADGRMEYGPRALGNRSILYQPGDRSVNDWLNANLRRTEFMPFAPATLYEHRDRCFEDVSGAEHAAEFMTITFDCSRWMRKRMEGVVHLDGTARPQLVRRDRSPRFHRIVEAFHQRTGLPAIINTSFNIHEEPIVRSAADCVRAFLDGHLDYLAIGTHLVPHPRGITHALRRAVGAAGRETRHAALVVATQVAHLIPLMPFA